MQKVVRRHRCLDTLYRDHVSVVQGITATHAWVDRVSSRTGVACTGCCERRVEFLSKYSIKTSHSSSDIRDDFE